jgi:citrate lyase subunit beta/citryl-CoA lyase
MSSLATARTWLFVPGDRPERFDKAAASGADIVIVDLEDAVAPENKHAARDGVAAALDSGARIAVRINASDTVDFGADLDMLAGTRNPPLALVIAKAETADGLAGAQSLGVPLIPLVESARGLLAAQELARARSVARLAFGAVDFSLDIGSGMHEDVLGHGRFHLVVASRAAGIAAPIDSPTLSLRDEDVITRSAAAAKRYGMSGKLCIHPAQVPIVARAFSPTPEEIDRARKLIAAAQNDGAVAHGGSLVDRPVLEKARRVLLEASIAADDTRV